MLLLPNCDTVSYLQVTADTSVESPQEETTEPASEHDSEQYPEDDVPEDEGEDDEEEEDDDADDVHYKVIPLSSFKRLITR